MPRKTKGGASGMPTINQIQNISNLDYSKPYQEFNYDKYVNNIKQSNFAGGCYRCKFGAGKLSKFLNHSFEDYKKGKQSFIRKMTGGDPFPVSLQDMQNTSSLNYKTPFQYEDIKRLQSVPFSKLSI